jgi:hypothetical protein
MSLFHVSIEGLDRRALTALGTKHRAVLVGRHFVDRSKAKIISYTMEFGRTRASTPFHPPYSEMRKVMREVTAGLLEFCLKARPLP